MNSLPEISPFAEQPSVAAAPLMADLAAAPDCAAAYDDPLRYWVSPRSTRMAHLRGTLPADTPQASMSEGAAIVEAIDYLAEAEATLTNDPDLQELARYTRENISFISTKALNSAASGLAGLWQNFLDQDKRHRIVVPTRVLDAENRKSGDYLYEKITGHLESAGGEQYTSRLSTTMADIRRFSREAFTKIVLLDDYSISGTQLTAMYSRISSHRGFSRAHTEAHLVAASNEQLNNHRIAGQSLPVYGYYAVRECGYRDGPLITGAHSAADFGFVDTIERIAGALDPAKERPLPALANIVKPY